MTAVKYPMAWSFLLHGVIAAIVVAVMSFTGGTAKDLNEYVDFAYEEFDAPPVPAEVVQKVKATPEPITPVQEKAPEVDQPKELQDATSDIAGTQKESKPEANIGSTATGTANATPYYRIKPKYPRAALEEGIEGWILLEIDITEAGEVENIRVIGGEPRNMFQSEARRAVAQWKYKPFLDAAGHPVRIADHHVKVEFTLNDAETQSRN